MSWRDRPVHYGHGSSEEAGLVRFWRTSADRPDDLSDVEASPRVALDVAASAVVAAVDDVVENSARVADEVLGAEAIDGSVIVTFGHAYDRRTALRRRLNSLRHAEIEVRDFAWLDPVTHPDDRWLTDVFASWEAGRHRDPNRIEPVELARRRFGRMHGQDLLVRLLELVAAPGMEQRRRWTIAHAAVVAGFNTHTTDAGDALVAAGAHLADIDGYTAMSLLDGARGVAELGRFGIRTAIAEQPLVPLLDHSDWHVHGAATELLATLEPPRSDAATDVLVGLALRLAGGSRSTEIRAMQVVGALATAPSARSDADAALDRLRHHASSGVRVGATQALADRRPDSARPLWEPWLRSRSANERTAAESMISTFGDERDVPEVVRIVEHRIQPTKRTSYWPPLSAVGLAFLVRHAHVPEASAALGRVRDRWDRHDDDLRNWLRLHHPDLVPSEDGD